MLYFNRAFGGKQRSFYFYALSKTLLLSGDFSKIRFMRHFICIALICGLSTFIFGQKVTPKPQDSKAKTSVKTKKSKPKTNKTADVKTIEAATKDGKAVILKSNGTWEYTKPVVEIKPTAAATPTATPNPSPVIAAVKTMPTPKTNATPAPVAKTTTVSVSNKCDLGLNDSPVIRGLKLGMSRDEADKIIPLDRVRILNSSAISAYPQFGKTQGFENVYQITAQFGGEALERLEIVYDPTYVKWKSAKEFAENLSSNFNIPSRFWKYDSKNAALSELRCREFTVSIDSESNEIRLERVSAAQTGDESIKAFKP
jgi:hypothetical protein